MPLLFIGAFYITGTAPYSGGLYALARNKRAVGPEPTA